jgi:hypothetical protein
MQPSHPQRIITSERLPMQWPPPKSEHLEDDWQLFPEAFQAWRSWRVVEWDGELILQSITYKDTNWIPRQEVIAECRPSLGGKVPEIPHPAPDPRHGCGLYSVKSQDSAAKWLNYVPTKQCGVFGRVSIWGHIFEFERGYLSEFAYPSFLIISESKMGEELSKYLSAEELAITLMDTYQVEVVTE